MKRRVLITNDDGIQSPGLVSLLEALLESGQYDVCVVAPDSEQSGVGHCLTLHSDIYAVESDIDTAFGRAPGFRIDGTPADCVKVALTNLFTEFKPDVVLSGINRGMNVGTSILYSGTVAGALEAVLNSVPAMALSMTRPLDEQWDFQPAAQATLRILEVFFNNQLPPYTILNVNFPCTPPFKGYRFTHVGRSGYDERYNELPSEDGRRRFSLVGTFRRNQDAMNFDDVALAENWVSVSLLHASLEYQERDVQAPISQWPLFAETF